MAGDWIKMRVNLVGDPAVRAMARALKVDAFSIVGRLHAFWAWADEHTENGEIPWTTSEDIDQIVQLQGFSDRLKSVGWLEDLGECVRIPNFERHNGAGAKRRVMEAERKRKQRDDVSAFCPDSVPQKTGHDADKSGTREEKRREEKSISNPPIVPLAKTELQARTEKLHGKRATTPWDKAELAAWKAAQPVVAATTDEEWGLLEAFYAEPQEKTYARKSLATTLNNWSGEISRAREWAKRNQSGWQPPIGDF